MRKITLILCLFLGLPLISVANANYFNPELVSLSKMKTIKTWVAKKFHKNKLVMKNLQASISELTQQNPNLDFSKINIRTVDDGSGFGRTFPLLEANILPYYRFINRVSKKKNPVVVEFGAANGLVSRFVPFAFENPGKLYAFDLSSKMTSLFERDIDLLEATFKTVGIKESITIVNDSCFEILTKYPELKGSVDAIYAQNLEHYFTPQEHKEFIELIDNLLAPGGRAFLSTVSIECVKTEQRPLCNQYKKEKELGNAYPGFMKFIQVIDRSSRTSKYLEVQLPAENERVGLIDSVSVDSTIDRMLVIFHYFFPITYERSIEPYPSLELIDGFFVTNIGQYATSEETPDILLAGAIIQKNSG